MNRSMHQMLKQIRAVNFSPRGRNFQRTQAARAATTNVLIEPARLVKQAQNLL